MLEAPTDCAHAHLNCKPIAIDQMDILPEFCWLENLSDEDLEHPMLVLRMSEMVQRKK